MKNLLKFVRGYLTPNARPAVLVYPQEDENNEVIIVRRYEHGWVDEKDRRWRDDRADEDEDEVLAVMVGSTHAPPTELGKPERDTE